MILEKIRQHAWKILCLSTGVLLIVIGASAARQKKLEQISANLTALAQERANKQSRELLSKASESQANVQAVQAVIVADRQQKLDTLSNNPAIVTKQETVPVTKVIPGATRKVTVKVAASSSSSSSSSSKSSSTPAKSTKTS